VAQQEAVISDYKNTSNCLTVKSEKNFFLLLYRSPPNGVEVSDRQREPTRVWELESLQRQLRHNSLPFQALLLEAEQIHPNKTRRST